MASTARSCDYLNGRPFARRSMRDKGAVSREPQEISSGRLSKATRMPGLLEIAPRCTEYVVSSRVCAPPLTNQDKTWGRTVGEMNETGMDGRMTNNTASTNNEPTAWHFIRQGTRLGTFKHFNVPFPFAFPWHSSFRGSPALRGSR